jgi:hypothetical protein
VGVSGHPSITHHCGQTISNLTENKEQCLGIIGICVVTPLFVLYVSGHLRNVNRKQPMPTQQLQIQLESKQMLVFAFSMKLLNHISGNLKLF